MIGPFINSAGIVTGSILGAVCASTIPADFRKKINYVFSCITLGIGVFMTGKCHALPPVVIAVLFGAILGEVLRVEKGVMRLAFRAVNVFQRKKTAKPGLPQQMFRDQFAVVTVLFCVSSLGIMGPMQEGISGDPSLLIIKALLDFFTSMVFASNIGGVIGVLAAPQCLIQSSILLLSTAVVPSISPSMIADFSACGRADHAGHGLAPVESGGSAGPQHVAGIAVRDADLGPVDPLFSFIGRFSKRDCPEAAGGSVPKWSCSLMGFQGPHPWAAGGVFPPPVDRSGAIRVGRAFHIGHYCEAAQLDRSLTHQIDGIARGDQGPDRAVLGGQHASERGDLRVLESHPVALGGSKRGLGLRGKARHDGLVGRVELSVPGRKRLVQALGHAGGGLVLFQTGLQGGIDR
jgi:uncharacterized membrane protein YqgA involved in biofilm formation